MIENKQFIEINVPVCTYLLILKKNKKILLLINVNC